jgi:hypothetical protein
MAANGNLVLEFGSWDLGLPDETLSPIGTQVAVTRCPAKIRVSSGALAQLVRAPPCHGGGCGFEPRRLRGFCIRKNRVRRC